VLQATAWQATADPYPWQVKPASHVNGMAWLSIIITISYHSPTPNAPKTLPGQLLEHPTEF
jgi:hypothetical protein